MEVMAVILMLSIFGNMFMRPDMMREPGEPPLNRELMLKMTTKDHKRMDERQAIRRTENAGREGPNQSQGYSDSHGPEAKAVVPGHQEGDDLLLWGEHPSRSAVQSHQASLWGWGDSSQETFEVCGESLK